MPGARFHREEKDSKPRRCPFFNSIPHCLSSPTKNREINGANFNFLLPTDRVPIPCRGPLKFPMTARGLFIADLRSPFLDKVSFYIYIYI